MNLVHSHKAVSCLGSFHISYIKTRDRLLHLCLLECLGWIFFIYYYLSYNTFLIYLYSLTRFELIWIFHIVPYLFWHELCLFRLSQLGILFFRFNCEVFWSFRRTYEWPCSNAVRNNGILRCKLGKIKKVLPWMKYNTIGA